MDKSFDLTPLVDSLSNSFARRLGLNRRGFIHLLQACHFEEGMLQFQGRRTQCDQLLELCRPVLDQLCQGPEEGWLRFCYETLAAGLFPDPSRPPATAKQREAMEFYLQILEWLLAREQSFCPFDPLLDPHWSSQEELADSRLSQEYAVFRKAVLRDRFPTLLRRGREGSGKRPAAMVS